MRSTEVLVRRVILNVSKTNRSPVSKILAVTPADRFRLTMDRVHVFAKAPVCLETEFLSRRVQDVNPGCVEIEGCDHFFDGFVPGPFQDSRIG